MKQTSSVNNHDIKQQLYWAQLDQAQLAADRAARIKQIIDASFAALTGYYSQLAEIQSDPDLSASGQRSRTDAAGQRALGVINGLAKPAIAELDGEILRYEQSLTRAANGEADDVARTLLKLEVRRKAESVDPLMLETFYTAMCRDGTDNLSCEALEQGPSFAPMIRAEIMHEGRITRAAKIHPEIAESLRQASEARSILAGAVAQATATLVVPFRSAADIGAVVDDVDANGVGAANVPA